MAPETLLYLVVGEGLCITGIIKAVREIIRIGRSKVIWGEIVSFKKLPEKERRQNEEPEEPDYYIEVRFEHEGMTHTAQSVIKKEIHYEKGGRIKVFLPNDEVEAAKVDYNVQVGYYVLLIISVFMGLFFVYQCLINKPVDMSIQFYP